MSRAGATSVLKRAFDVALAGAGLVASAPLWVIFAAAIKLEDGGPVFYSQERGGFGGGVFDALKFRSMDELPQLWNIFRGDMSFVGPRALRPGEVESSGGAPLRLDQVPGYEARIAVRPGLTGVAQIYAPRDVPRRQKFRYDRLYVRQQSMSLDLRLILLSFWISFLGTWESRGRKY